jgi:hypothetical protein
MPVARAPVQWMFGMYFGFEKPSNTNPFGSQVVF